VAPYGWFRSSLESVLNGFDASFFSGATHRALHTDLMTPVATFPTWTDPAVRAHWPALEIHGVPLWHELVEELQPHIALVSFNREYLSRFALPVVKTWAAVAQCTKAWGAGFKTLEFEPQVVELASGQLMDMVYGPQKFEAPFSGLTNDEKLDIGRSSTSTGTKGKLTWG
jgi:hypothetical protein